MTTQEIAALIGADLQGDGNVQILRVAKIEQAGPGDVSFLSNPKYQRFLGETKASAVIVGKAVSTPESGNGPVLLRVDDPYVGFLKVLVTFNPPAEPIPPGIHPSAVIAATATIGRRVRIGAHAFVGELCVLDEGAIIGHGVVLGDGVSIGRDSLLYANVTVREGCQIGSRVIVHPGTTVGSDGFGFAPKPDGTYEKIPQVGIVVIEDDVEIGANCAIDRATMGETRIKRGAKLDNLIQVAHNVVIGENTVIAAQTGISGSTHIGSGVQIGGQVGLTGHLEIADKTRIGAQSGVHRSIKEPGTTIFGYPAYPHREAMRIQGAMVQLPDLLQKVRELRERLEQCETALRKLGSMP